MNHHQQQVIALAGACQALALLPELVNHGRCSSTLLKQNIAPIFEFNPSSTLAVYGDDLCTLKPGLNMLATLLTSHHKKDIELSRYLMSASKIARRLLKSPTTQAELERRLKHLQLHYPLTEESWHDHQLEIVAALGGIYEDVLSPLTSKIMVYGNALYLQQPQIKACVRTLLLAAVRSAVLWLQVGGRISHFLFSRKKLINSINDLLLLS